MAHKKGAGSTKNGRDSNAKRLGVKRFGGENVRAGNILEIGRAHVWTPVTHRNLVCRLLLEKNFFNDTATTEIYTAIDTLSLHDALPI